jgi:hypothetical protein
MAQNKATAAEAGMVGLHAFRDDLRAAASEIEAIRTELAARGFYLTPVRILDALLWRQQVSRE